MNKFGLYYIYTWKYHKETPCVGVSFFFSFTKSENRRAEQVLQCGEGLVPVGGGRRWGEV
jgi:hypothetical protein